MEVQGSPILSVVTPFYNEEVNCLTFLEELSIELKIINCSYEIICVDDGSKDNTLQKMKHYQDNLKIIEFSRNFGKECAISAGLDFSKGKSVVIYRF